LLDGDGFFREDVLDGILEELEPGGGFGERFGGFAGPVRVVGRVGVAFGMGHEAQHEAGGVADTGDIVSGAVGVAGEGGRGVLGRGVAEGDLFAGFEIGELGVGLGDEAAFAVGDGEIEGAGHAFGPDADRFLDGINGDPFVCEAAGEVVGEGSGLAACVGFGEEAELDHDLEAVADADHGYAALDGVLNGLVELVAEAVGEDASGGDVVAVGEAAGEADDVDLLEDGGVGDEVGEVLIEGLRAGEVKGVGEFAVAVGAGGTDDECYGLGHRGDILGDFCAEEKGGSGVLGLGSGQSRRNVGFWAYLWEFKGMVPSLKGRDHGGWKKWGEVILVRGGR
jgi:hypothetical protein